jgi:predicted alpha-1,2-mannosidase
MKIKLLSTAGLIVLLISLQSFNPADLVNPLQGSASDVSFSTGNTYPAVALPWGMNFWTPQTGKMGDGWQYTYSATHIRGFKQTHQPSPWINDYGCFSLMPVCGTLRVREEERKASFSHAGETARPYYYGVDLNNAQMKAEITPSNSGAIFRFGFAKSDSAFIVIDGYRDSCCLKVIPEENKIIGYSRYYSKNNNMLLPDNFATYFVITVNKPFKVFGVWNDSKVFRNKAELKSRQGGAFIGFKVAAGEQIELKVASSFISPAQAERNFKRELAGKTFESLKAGAQQIWNRSLARVKVEGGTREQQRTFYTALYRMMLFPRKLQEHNASGKLVHYSALNGKVENGPMYTDNGFWDTFRAVHPFFTIMYPQMSGEIMQALVNYYKEGGWMPEWSSPAYRDCMIGQHSVSLVADAYLKGIRNFDVAAAWEAIEKGASHEGPNATGRSGFEYYNRLGYVPCDVNVKENTSKTIEYAYDDYCISRFAKAIGKDEATVGKYAARALNYRNLFDKRINFMRPKDHNGNWKTPFRPDSWGDVFTEGSSWHWTWAVFHDPQGLIGLMGGQQAFINKLDSVFIAKPTFDFTAYGREIHEMTEMVACNMGQYAHGNQPIQHGVYLYAYAGAPYKTQKWVRHIMDTQYHSGIGDGKGLCGDEDNGQTSAWYVFSAMGFYPVCPGSLQYVIGSPLFPRLALRLPSGKIFRVIARNNSDKNIYIRSIRLNGKPLHRTYLWHKEIVNGGVLECEMGAEPNLDWGTEPGAAPFSMSSK